MTDAAATANDTRTPAETSNARDLFSKFDPLIAEREALLATGVRDPFAIVMDEVKSPTQAVIKGKDTILLGTYNYMGMTFDPDVVAAGKKALDDFGAGTTGGTFCTCRCRVVKVSAGEKIGLASFIGLPCGSSFTACVTGSSAGRTSKMFLKPWVPQANTNTVRMIHGIHARITAGRA